MALCRHCNTECTEAHYARTVYNQTPLFGAWSGWRMAGKSLVAPTGERINPQRLAGILWGEQLRKRYPGGRVPKSATGVPGVVEGLQAAVARLRREASP